MGSPPSVHFPLFYFIWSDNDLLFLLIIMHMTLSVSCFYPPVWGSGLAGKLKGWSNSGKQKVFPSWLKTITIQARLFSRPLKRTRQHFVNDYPVNLCLIVHLTPQLYYNKNICYNIVVCGIFKWWTVGISDTCRINGLQTYGCNNKIEI